MGMTAAVAESAFPAGFHQEHRLGNGDFGQVWSARESGCDGGPDIPRVVRILPPSAFAENDFRDALFQRCARLKSRLLPFVSVPTHMERLEEGSIAIIEPDLQISLARWLSPGRKVDSAELERWTEQILTGLASLHAAKMSHGDIRLGNVFLIEGEGTARRTAWLGDTAVGPLTCWSRGVLMNSDATASRPPEWGNDWKEPEPRADLYALGVMLWNVLCPESALPKPDTDHHRTRPTWRPLASASASRALKELVPHLLAADPQERPQDAPAALRLFRRLQWQQHRRPWLLASAIIVPLFVMAATAAVLRHAEASRLNAELQLTHKDLTRERDRSAGLERELTRAREANGSLETALKAREDEATARNQELVARVGEINALKRENAELRRIPPPRSVPPAFDEQELAARILWQEAIRRSEAPDGQLALVRESIEKSEKDSKLLKHLDLWEKEAHSLVTSTRAWSRADATLREGIRQIVREPWNSEPQAAARRRLDALNAAGAQWKLWAESERLKPEDIEKQLSHEPLRSNEPGKILSQWWAEIQPGKHPKWTLRLIRGRSDKPGYGTTRMAGVRGTAWAYSARHDWDDPQTHEYPNDDTAKIPFEWKPGESAGFCLLGEFRALTVYTTRPYLIQANETFQGPLAVWLMHSWGAIEHNGFAIEYEILDCPGPPPSLLQKVEAAVKAAISSPGGSAQ